ncbi:MAG: DUF445 family protein [Firmicutes bacterium]|nr:DUF445 family protein [Bacillota bacterium]
MIAKQKEPTRIAAPEEPAVVNDFSIEQRFIEKWGGRVAADFRTRLIVERGTGKKDGSATKPGKKPLSLRLAFLFNLLNYPLFFLGILLVLWLLAEPILQRTLPVDLFQPLQAYSAPLISVLSPAVVGYWTNWLAIKMLFHPRHPNAVWQGLIHARREALIESMAAGIMSSLISPEIVDLYLREEGIYGKLTAGFSSTLEEVFQEAEFRAELKAALFNLVDRLVNNPRTREAVDQYLAQAIEEWRGGSLGEKMIEWTKQFWGEVVRKEALGFLPEVPRIVEAVFPRIEAYLQTLPQKIEAGGPALESLVAGAIIDGVRSLDLEAVIRGQLERLDAAALEKLLTSNVSGELVFIQTSGGVFGFLVGLALIYQPLRLILLAGGVLIWGLYQLTVEKREADRTPK